MKQGRPREVSILGIPLFFMVLISFSTIASAAKEKAVIKIPEGSVGMIAYGSLISLRSMEETLGHKYEGPIRPVHLAGYERAWTCVRPFNDPEAIAAGRPKIEAYIQSGTERVPITGAVELNIYPKDKGRINGILYLVTGEELARFDKRERGYRRVDVTDKIEEFRFREGKVYVYEGLPVKPEGPLPDKGVFIAIKEFVEMVAGACDTIGKDFRIEFDETTGPCSYPIVSYKQVVWGKAE
jgi:hypothetical protein